VDTRHAPLFWFPRDCPRGCIWATTTTTGGRLYACRLPAGPFRPHEVVGGYWVTEERVRATDRVVVDDLLGRHARAGIELRITPSIWPFWRQVADSTVGFSGSRLRNTAPHPLRLD
jgi:hypothetical protein